MHKSHEQNSYNLHIHQNVGVIMETILDKMLVYTWVERNTWFINWSHYFCSSAPALASCQFLILFFEIILKRPTEHSIEMELIE